MLEFTMRHIFLIAGEGFSLPVSHLPSFLLKKGSSLDFLTDSFIWFFPLQWSKLSPVLISALLWTFQTLLCTGGELAQMVERRLRMREIPGSIPWFSKLQYRYMRFHHTCYDVIFPRSESTLPVLVHVDILNSDLAPGFAEIKYNWLIAPILN